jgi:hypothetical protein
VLAPSDDPGLEENKHTYKVLTYISSVIPTALRTFTILLPTTTNIVDNVYNTFS